MSRYIKNGISTFEKSFRVVFFIRVFNFVLTLSLYQQKYFFLTKKEKNNSELELFLKIEHSIYAKDIDFIESLSKLKAISLYYQIKRNESFLENKNSDLICSGFSRFKYLVGEHSYCKAQ